MIRYTIEVPTVYDYNEENDTDVLATVLSDYTASDYYDDCLTALKSRFTYRMFGHTEIADYWIPVFKLRIDASWKKWTKRFEAYETYKANLADDTDRVITTDTDAQSEDLPETTVSTDTPYLKDRTSAHTVQSESHGKPAETLDDIQRLIDAAGDPYGDWARTFDDLFLNRWAV